MTYSEQKAKAFPFSGIWLNPGNSGFTEIRRGKYIDKTGLIRFMNRQLGTADKLVCVSRPRRFGKSYAAKMLCAYYDRSCNSAELFRDLEIARDPGWDCWLNKLNVINLDITGFISAARAEGRPVSGVVRDIRKALQEELREAYPDISGDSTGALLARIAKAYREQFFFIIDEWDALFRDAAMDYSVQVEYMNFLRELFENGSVTSVAIAGAYMTGILPIRKDGSESAVSDFREYTILNPGILYPHFGFTEKEVKSLCRDYSMDFEETRFWYDGYSVGVSASVYNPYSVMMAMQYHHFDSYWRRSAASDVLSEYIGMDFDGLSVCVASLLGGSTVPVETGGFNNDLTSLKSKDDVLTLLIHFGYLAYDWNEKTVRIPNEELRLEFSRSVKEVKNTETLRRVKESERLIMDTAAQKEEAVASAVEKVHREETSPPVL